MNSIFKLLSKSIVGLFAFPVFSVLTAGLFISALLAFAAGIARTFGMNLGMSMGMFQIPRVLSLPFALLFCVLFFCLAICCWKMLRISFRFVVSSKANR